MKPPALRAACTAVLAIAIASAPASAAARPARSTTVPDRAAGVLAGTSPGDADDRTLGLKSTTWPVDGVSALAADTRPGTPVQWLNAWTEPITGALDAAGKNHDFYSVYLEAGEQLIFELYGPVTGADFDLNLYDPAGLLADDDDGNNIGSTETIEGDVSATGVWSVEVVAAEGSGPYELAGYFASPDDDVPAVPIGRTPIVTTLDSYSDWDDVYRIWLNAGEVLTLTLSRGSTYTPGFYPNLYLYPPGTASVWDVNAPIEGREGLTFPKTIRYSVPTSGNYYVDIFEANPEDVPDTHEYGEANLTWKISSPVYRFYNVTNNTHFFTPSASERDTVISRWPNIYRFEGLAYYTNPANNTTPLTRLYNKVSNSHFYTASWSEAASALAKWPAVFQLDGPTYAVNPGPVPNSLPVYRFYNMRNGSHFFTASETEKNMVIATWPNIYRFEGPAFWIGQ